MSQPLEVKGLGTMSRMTLLKGELWLGDTAPDRVIPQFVRSPQTGGYPPYNIELIAAEGEADALRITLAVAGFGLDELAVIIEDGELVVRGQQAEEVESRNFLYRGIAARRFKRSFALADGVEVRNAKLKNGLLAIELERPIREATVKTVTITSHDTGGRTRGAPASRRATVSDAE
jgi:HSP20 family molecular chaperone IbpA